jgi:hypothetical protein
VLAFLNQDTRVEPGWRDGLVRGLDEETVGLTTSKLLLMSRPERVQLGGQNVHYTGLTFSRGFLSPAARMAERREVGAVSGASFAVRRAVWEELGGFDEIFFTYYEETDLAWRARQAGYRCLYTPDSVAFHDGSLAPPGPFQFYYFARNRRLMIMKNWRWPTLVLLSPGLVLAEWIEWRLALASGWSGVRAKVRADLWVWGHLKRIAGRHALAQAARRVSDAVILSERDCRMTPSTVTGGPAGRLAIRVCDALFGLNHRLALRLCRALSL